MDAFRPRHLTPQQHKAELERYLVQAEQQTLAAWATFAANPENDDARKRYEGSLKELSRLEEAIEPELELLK